MANQTVETLEVTDSIVLKHPDAKIGITMKATPTGAGIWIGQNTFVAIHNIDKQICLALGSPKDRSGHAVAIGINESDGEPFIQFARPGKEPMIVSGEKLERLFD